MPDDPIPQEDGSTTSRLDLVHALLRNTSIEALRKEAQNNPKWRPVYRGFRPNYLDLPTLLRWSRQFSQNLLLLNSLLDVFLSEHQIARSGDRSSQLRSAAELPNLSEDLKRLLLAASEIGIEVMPSFPEQGAASADPSARTSQPSGDLPPTDLPADHDPEPTPSELSDAAAAATSPLSDEPAVAAITNSTPSPSLAPQRDPEIPCLRERVPLDWQAPQDHVRQAQEAVTLFERGLVAFVRRQLQALHGDAWVRRGCAHHRQTWLDRSGRNSASEPTTLIGYAEIGELKDIIVNTTNWPAFRSYFGAKDEVIDSLSAIISLRVSSMHPSERAIHFSEQYKAFAAMVGIAETFHTGLAQTIDDLFRATITNQALPPTEEAIAEEPIAGEAIITNLGDFSPDPIIGRENKLLVIQSFWDDPFARVLSIAGQGGIGKTALMDTFTYRLLRQPRPPEGRPTDPEMIIYLTAKTNYLPNMPESPPSRRFDTLRRILDITLQILDPDRSPSGSLEDDRLSVYSLAKTIRILFCLDNLESLLDSTLDASDDEYEAVLSFLDDLPSPSKAIITTRVDKRSGRKIVLSGLTPEDSRAFLIQRINDQGVEPSAEDEEHLNELISYTEGIPLALVFIANHVAHGHSISDTSKELKGKGFIEVLHFSFDSSMKLLTNKHIQVLLFLSISSIPRTRSDLMPFVTDGDELTDIIRDLEMMSFIEKPAERSNRVLFTVNRLMRDYVIGQANYRLSPAEHASVYHRANMRPAEVASPSVRIEIEKAITSAQDLARYDRDMAIAELEKARGVWGDDPRLLEQLGYLYFRVRQRGKARMLLEMAVGSGYESAGLYVELALVLYHDRDFDNALRYAERALVLKRHFPLAELVAGESLVDSCSRSSFMLSSDEKIRMLERAREHLRRSLVYPSRSKGDEGQNARASNFLRVAEREIDRLRQAEAVADRGRRR